MLPGDLLYVVWRLDCGKRVEAGILLGGMGQ